jgi:hypothetical protein
MKKWVHVILLVAVSCVIPVFFSGCATKLKPTTGIPITTQQTDTTTSQTTSNLDNAWVLKALGDINNLTSILENRQILLYIENNATYYHGGIGTFQYGGQMTSQGNNIKFLVITSTPIEIPDDPPGFQKQAHEYLGLLTSAKTYAVNGNELLMICDNNQGLKFSKYQP